MNHPGYTPAVMYLPMLDIPGEGLVAVNSEFEIEREACDHSEQLARAGFGRYAAAIAVVSDVWLATDPTRGGEA